MDVTVSDNVEFLSNNDATANFNVDVVNNSTNSFVSINKFEILPSNQWILCSMSDDFTRKGIDTNEVAFNYLDYYSNPSSLTSHDMIQPYTNPIMLTEGDYKYFQFEAKTSISSTSLNENVADIVFTLEYVKKVVSLRAEYSEVADVITSIKPEFLKVTGVYSDGSEKLLNESEYTVNDDLFGHGVEEVYISYNTQDNIPVEQAIITINNPYIVTLISDGTTETIKYKFGIGITLPTPTKGGYSFGGWYNNSLFEGNPITKIDANIKEDKTFYAKWDALYNITYNLDGGTLPIGSKTEFTSNETVELPIPTKAGYEFAGWDEKINYTLGDYWETDVEGNLLVSDNLNNYSPYSISSRAPGADSQNEINRIIDFKIKNTGKLKFDYLNLKAMWIIGNNLYGGYFIVEKDGERILNKNIIPETTQGTWMELSGNLSCDLNLTAGNYKIIFGGIGSFGDYKIGVTGTVKNLDISSSITSIPKGTNEDKVLTAKWLKKHTITYNLDGGTLPIGSKTEFTSNETVELPVPTKAGYTFDGWIDKVNYTLGDYWEKDSDGNLLVSDNLNNSSSYHPEPRAPEPGNAYAIERGLKFKMESIGRLSFKYHCRATNNEGIYGGKYEIYKNGALVQTKSIPEFSGWYSSGIITCNFNLTQGDYSIIFYGHSNSYGSGITGTVKNFDISSSITSIPKGTNEDKTLTAKWTKNPSELTTVTDMKAKLGSYYTDAKQISFVKSSNIVDYPTIASIDISKNQDGSIIANVTSADARLYNIDVNSEARAGEPSSGSLGYKITVKSEGIILAPTDCSSMFYNCDNLTSLDVSNFNTSNVTDMNFMFFSCNNLTSLDLSYFNTSNVTNMSGMFFGCDILASLDLSYFKTNNVTSMEFMFFACNSLTSLDLSSFNTSNVTNMKDMFNGCYELTSLNLSSFNTSNVINMEYMFLAVPNNLIPSWYDSSKWEKSN